MRAMSLTPGTKLGPYEIVSLLGTGGMGEVYRAKDTRLGRDVAIKVLPASVAKDADRLRRFEQEARTVATLNHPNILALHDIGTYEGSPFLVSELLEGETLRQKIEAGPLPVRRAMEYAKATAQGLAAAHEKGIVHRDLKPENIFITRDDRTKILDFGLAKLVLPESNADAATTLTSPATLPGVVMGTVGYMSPEQVRGLPTDARSDIFGFGAVLYEMLTGKRAFKKDTTAETMTAILREEPPELMETNWHGPIGLQKILSRCLEKSPERRFQSASDLAFAIESLSGTSTSPSVAAQAIKEGVNWPKWILSTGVGALLLVVAAAGWWYGRGANPPSQPAYQQITFERGFVYAARFAADGRSVVYSASWDGQPLQIYSTVEGSPESRSLNLVNSTLFAVSSTDLAISIGCKNRYIGDCQGTLARVPISGGAPRELANDIIAADWMPDGNTMTVVSHVEGKYRVEYPRGKVIYENVHPLGHLRVSPTGTAIAFAQSVGETGDGGRVLVLDTDGKELTRTRVFISVEGLAWPASGDEVWVAAATDKGWADSIYGIRMNGQQRLVLRLPGMVRLHDISRNGSILLSKESWRSELMFRGPGDAKDRRLSWLDYAEVTDLSDDGKMVAFSDWGEAAGATALGFVRKTDGSPAVKLGSWDHPVLSPDGKWILAVEGEEIGHWQLALVPAGVGEVQKLPTTGIQQLGLMGWMPDSKAVYYGADDGHGWRMYLRDVPGAAPRPVTPVISFNPYYTEGHVVSPDGKYVFARNLNGKGAVFPLSGGDPREIPGWLTEDIWIRWSKDGREAYVYHDEKTSATIYRLDMNSGKRQQMATLTPLDVAGVTSISNLEYTPDGKAYAFSDTQELSDLFVVQGVR
jgi:serine/threonine protein kinase/Tol biopolymer transport system component